jgi:Lrp/AsnC family leucine-responsive transcriptional regulator
MPPARRPVSAADRRILAEVQRNGRIANVELAEKVGMAASPCLRRLKALEENGIIIGWRAEVDGRALGWGVEAFAFVKLAQSEEGWRTRLVERLKVFDEVVACWALSGEVDLLLRCVAADLEAYGEFAMNRLLTLPGVADVRSSFVMGLVKPDRGLPLPPSA